MLVYKNSRQGLCGAMAAPVGRIGLLECYKIIAIETNCDGDASSGAPLTATTSNQKSRVRQKRRHFKSSAHSLLSRSHSLLRAARFALFIL